MYSRSKVLILKYNIFRSVYLFHNSTFNDVSFLTWVHVLFLVRLIICIIASKDVQSMVSGFVHWAGSYNGYHLGNNTLTANQHNY